MTLSSLSLTHFRSYQKRTLIFSPDTTLIVGANTAGKTNILEAIMLLATGRSFRASREQEMLTWEAPVGFVVGKTGGGEGVSLEVRLADLSGGMTTTPRKRLLVNGVPRRLIDFAGNLHAVLFWPEDLELITDSPGLRRKYIDTVLVQTDREYRRNLLSYERGLRQRNRLLALINEGKAQRSQLLFWNQLLIGAGNYITDARASYFAYLNTYRLADLSFTAVYDKSIISEPRLIQYKDEEIAAKATLVGPHRDDFSVYDVVGKKERALASFGSRGEQRLSVLWLKLGELSYMEKTLGNRPLLLLDDIFSELDKEHRALVVDIMGKQQTIATSADPAIIEEIRIPKTHIISL
jgi:DNA replication and repair protein RecF